MHSPLLNIYIFTCKLLICISISISINTHYWTRKYDGEEHQGFTLRCFDYGRYCYESPIGKTMMYFFYIITLLNFIFELLNILLLCKRTRSRINLVLEELAILTTIIFLLAGTFVGVIGIFAAVSSLHGKLDWSFIIFYLSLIISFIDLICSLVRVVSYCRENSFRSNVITYTSKNNHEMIHIQE